MIRANLLPASRATWRVFGVALDRERARTCVSACTAIAAVAAATFGLETLAFARLHGEAQRALDAVDAHAPLRLRAARIALDVARYQEFEREMRVMRRSGPGVAADIVRIGNAVPAAVRLDALAVTQDRIELNGTAQSLETMGDALAALDRALPGTAATLVRLERRGDASPLLHFAARVGRP
jgi:hypothetical protein